MYTNILVPLDQSEVAEAALPVARQLAKSFGATVHILESVTRQDELQAGRGAAAAGSIAAAEYELETARRLIESRIERAKSYIERAATALRSEGLEVRTEVREGAADEAISLYARENDIDLIVMSTHGHGRIRRALLGSVTDRVIRSAHVPVLVLPPK